METEQKALAPAPAAAPVTTPQYLGGFSGMAIEPFPDEVRKVLAEPVDPDAVELKPDGIVFAPGVWYRRQLTRAFGPGGWGLAMRGPVRSLPQQQGDLVVYHGALICLGRFVAEAHGQCIYWPNSGGMTYADAVEGARTDCITRCCKDLGMATELWDAGWRGRWMAQHALKAWVEGDGKRKGKFFFWRRDREPPYQAKGAKAQPAAEMPGEPPAPARAAERQPEKNPPKDDGEAVEDDSEDLKTLDELVFKSLKWKPDYAGRWLNARFGTRVPSSLTKLQLKTAFRLVYAFARGKEPYEVELEKCKTEGLVKA